MSKFDEKVIVLFRALPLSQHNHLNQSQWHCLGDLAQRWDLIIFSTDKNLGPSIAERRPYIRQILAEHLLNEDHCQYLPTEDAKLKLATQHCWFLKIYSNWSHTLPLEAKETYFKPALAKENLGQMWLP
jgi:hypothetical protein